MTRTKKLKAAFIVTTVAAASVLLGAGCNNATTNPPCAEADCIECPTEQPADGSSCGDIALSCKYGDPDGCAQDPEHTAVCGEDGTWAVSMTGSTCNPPPPPACPETLPIGGTVCEVNEVGDTAIGCSYTIDTACGEQMVEPTCVVEDDSEPRWEVTVPACAGDPSACVGVDHPDVCAADSACGWLVPGCTDEGPGFEAGCFGADACASGCAEGSSCQTVTHDPCVGSACNACAAEIDVCLPDPQGQ